MSGPLAETAPLHIRTTMDTALWPLLLFARSEPVIECVMCQADLLVGRLDGRPFSLAELTAMVDEHADRCPGLRVEPPET